MALRWTVLTIAAIETFLWVLIGMNGLFSSSDQATRGLDQAAAVIATGVFFVSGLPALLLAAKNQVVPLALGLALLPIIASATGVFVLMLSR